eukprot:6207866-Pleurochrysis_carterae.AAC.1
MFAEDNFHSTHLSGVSHQMSSGQVPFRHFENGQPAGDYERGTASLSRPTLSPPSQAFSLCGKLDTRPAWSLKAATCSVLLYDRQR